MINFFPTQSLAVQFLNFIPFYGICFKQVYYICKNINPKKDPKSYECFYQKVTGLP